MDLGIEEFPIEIDWFLIAALLAVLVGGVIAAATERLSMVLPFVAVATIAIVGGIITLQGDSNETIEQLQEEADRVYGLDLSTEDAKQLLVEDGKTATKVFTIPEDREDNQLFSEVSFFDGKTSTRIQLAATEDEFILLYVGAAGELERVND